MRLSELVADDEWLTERVWLRRRRDRNPFVSANIILTLEPCGASAGPFAAQIAAARRSMAWYRDRHLYYHWPLERGVSRMSDAPLARRLPRMAISPDADCTCLAHLAQGGISPGDLEAVIAELEFYRADGVAFRLPEFQRRLPGAAGSFLTWFPPRERCRGGKLETVDAGASANILWFLARHGRLDAAGAAETIAFVAGSVRSGDVVDRPFRVSMYYPRPAVLLYLISRAAVRGGIDALLALKPELLQLLDRCRVGSVLEALCRASAASLWQDDRAWPEPEPDGRGAFYVAPLLAWPLQRFAALEPLAATRVAQWEFRSEALEWALLHALSCRAPMAAG